MPAGVRQAWIGDSRQATFNPVEGNGETRIQARNYGAWAEAFSGCRLLFDARYVWGYSGQTAEYELTQYASTVAANYANFDMLFIESPGNDIDGTSNLFTSAIPAVISMASQALAASKRVTLMGMQPRTAMSSNQKLQMAQYNRWAASYAASTPGVYFVNVYADLANSDSTPLSGYYLDGTHVNGPGAFVIGERIWNTLSNLFPNTRPIFTPASEGYDATLAPLGNLVINPALTGAGGSKAAAGGSASLISGNVPTSWEYREGQEGDGPSHDATAQTTGMARPTPA